jgi:LCP family protein required for cell wall assembly
VEQHPTPNGRRIGARVAAAILSVGVLLCTGFGWYFYRDLTHGISTSDVITGGGPAAAPPGSDVNILLVGVDSRTDASGRPLSRQVLAQLRSGAEDGVLNSDTIILLHVPASGAKATAISIPRDSYVTISGHRKNKINSAYPAATIEAANTLRQQGADPLTVERRSRTAGRSELVKTVERLTGAKIDHYAEVNLLGFYTLTNAIGGVRVCLNKAVKEFRSGANFPAGEQTISGGAALAFVRQRYGLPQSDFSRIRRQQVFLAAVAHKILSAGTLTSPSKLTALIESAKESVVLDSGWDVLSFARQVSSIAGGNIEFLTIPTTGQTSNAHGDVVTVDPAQVRAFVRANIGAPAGASTPDPTDADSSGTPDAVPPSSLEVDVRNGTGRSGLAGKVSDKLAALGYQRGSLSNGPLFNIDNTGDTDDDSGHSSVHYPPGHTDAGEQVAKLLGNIDTEEDPRLAADSVRVYLGSDFSLSDISDLSAPDSSAPDSAAPDSAAPDSSVPDLSAPDLHARSGGASSARPTTPPPPPDPPITANGVPCVD